MLLLPVWGWTPGPGRCYLKTVFRERRSVAPGNRIELRSNLDAQPLGGGRPGFVHVVFEDEPRATEGGAEGKLWAETA